MNFVLCMANCSFSMHLYYFLLFCYVNNELLIEKLTDVIFCLISLLAKR